jgi:RNA polymerase sigma factor (sigma-70 family)
MNGDADRLRAYAERGCERAFEELVQRHIPLVYSVALRRVGGEHALAEEITQSVFLDLARKAASLPPEIVLPGWLHRHTCFVASNTVRREVRRRERERRASEVNGPSGEELEPLSWILPMLDQAINSLPDSDRTALLLRYYENGKLPEIARALGVSEGAAQKRISRALDKLRQFLKRQGGGELPAANFDSLLSTHAIGAIPAPVAGAIAASALAGAAAASATALSGQLLALTTMAKFKTTAVTALAIGMAVPIGIQYRALTGLRTENAALLSRTERLGEFDQLRAENIRLKTALSEREMLSEDFLELLRLRSEVGSLRQMTNELAARLAAIPSSNVKALPAEMGPNEVHLAKAVVLDPRANVARKLEALRLLRSADERPDEIVREMVHAYYATPDAELRTDIFRQLHGVKTPELQ